MIKTLLVLCTEAVAKYIVDDVYSSKLFVLDEKSSNLIFEEIHNQRKKKTPATLREVSQKLRVTHAKWKGPLHKVDDSEFELFYGQKELKSLVIDPEQDISVTDLFGGIETLKKIISPESCDTLIKLDLTRYCKYLIADYEKIGQLLPSLQFLELPQTNHSPKQCVKICENFTSLRKLDLTQSTILRLPNIQKLQNLVTLNLCDVRFPRRQNMIGLFELKQLQVLDISGNKKNNLKSLEVFVDCMETLPSLTTLDCSRNEIGDHTLLDKLVESHPTLRQIFLIATSAPEYKNDKVIIHQDTSLKSSINCMKYATSMFREPIVTSLLEKMKQWISNEYDDQDETTLTNLVVSILNTLTSMKTIADKQMHKLGTDCLVLLCTNKRVQNFNEVLQRELVDKVTDCMRLYSLRGFTDTFDLLNFPFARVNDEHIAHIQENYLLILNNNILLDNSSLPFDKVRAEVVELFKKDKINNPQTVKLLTILRKVWKKGNNGSIVQRSEEIKMKTELFDSFFEFNYLERTQENKYFLILKTMEEVFKYSENSGNKEFQAAHLLTNFHLPLFENNPYVQSKIFKVLEILLEKIYMHSMGVFLNQSTFRFFWRMIPKTQEKAPLLNYVVSLFHFDLKSRGIDSCIEDRNIMVYQILQEHNQGRPIEDQQNTLDNDGEPPRSRQRLINSEAMKHWRSWIAGGCMLCQLHIPQVLLDLFGIVRL